MKCTSLLVALLVVSATTFGQWEFHVASGYGYGMLIPSQGVRRHSPHIRNAPTKPGLFLSPSVALRVGANETFNLGYQLSSLFAGLRIAPPGIGKGRNYIVDGITIHNFYVGFEHQETFAKNHLKAGLMARAGIVYGQMTSMGSGSRSGSAVDGLFYAGTERITGFEVVPDFWAPSGALGLSLIPVFDGRRVGDRLKLMALTTLIVRNPYLQPSVAEYSLASPQIVENGRVYLSGMPVQLQLGIDYRLFPGGGERRSRRGNSLPPDVNQRVD